MLGGGPVEDDKSWAAPQGNVSGALWGRDNGPTMDYSSMHVNLSGKGGSEAFIFANDNHRCDYKPEPCWPHGTIVPRGWVYVHDKWDQPIYEYTNDWLVVAKKESGNEVAEPGTLALFGLGLMGLGYARRRRMI